MPRPLQPDLSGGPGQPQRRLQHCLSEFHASLTDHRPLGIAVSGGSDSLGLLCGLASILPPQKLVVLTVDHGLRPGSADEARRVKSLCRRLGVRHETLRWESGQPATGLQAAARAARYRLLAEASARLGLAAMLTAHTRDDQNETLTMRRARSSSDTAPGLAGIPPATLFDGRMWVLRPLLGIHRAEIRAFLRGAGVDWIEDPSNADLRFERVRVRSILGEAAAAAADPVNSGIAVARLELAGGAADFIDASCHFDAKDLVRVRISPDDAADVVASALEALIGLCGGASRTLDRRGKATLAGFLNSVASDGGNRTVSLGRTLIRRQGALLTLWREHRGIGKLDLPPGARGIWDGRYRVRNLSGKSHLSVSGDGSLQVSPSFSRDPDGTLPGWTVRDGVLGGFVCERLIGRSSHILPVHELPLAQALGRLARLKPLPSCPIVSLAGNPALLAVNLR